jgi:hypothetical protein
MADLISQAVALQAQANSQAIAMQVLAMSAKNDAKIAQLLQSVAEQGQAYSVNISAQAINMLNGG